MKNFFQKKIKQAVALRAALPASSHTNALRLVHGESDGLPGLIVDRYADVLVAQFLSAGAEHWREAILDALAAETGCEAIYERSDAEVRTLEGLRAAGRIRARQSRGEALPDRRARPATSASTSKRARRPASSSTSARTGSACARSPRGAKCWTRSATPAASRSRRSRAARST